MAKRKASVVRAGANPTGRELIVVTKPEAGIRAAPETSARVVSPSGADVAPLSKLLEAEDVSLAPLFGLSEDRILEKAAGLVAATGADIPDLSVFYQVEAPDERMDDLAEKFRQIDTVAAAYVKPPTEPAEVQLNDMSPRAEAPPSSTPDFTARQVYLNPAPVGIDAQYAWTLPGGRGGGVNIIDIEWGWRFTHEDLAQNQGGVLSGSNSSDDDHGTAVLGEFSGDRNSFGVTGISPDANVSSVSLVTHTTSQAIRIAADRLSGGDIILLEVHRGGPNYTSGDWTHFGYIAIEWWPDDFAAIRYAVGKGIVVVEAAGNGGQNLDAAIYNTRPVGFPTTWKNPFNTANPSSDAVLVGAGMPPPGTHGRNAHPVWGDVYADRGRCFFSNYGARVDTQGWGWEVTSTGYGDLQGGTNKDLWYTDQFSGTSSASPIVVGALACVQGARRASGSPLLDSAGARALLRSGGSPQQDGPAFTFLTNMSGTGYPQNHPARSLSQRIGTRPNLRQILPAAPVSRQWYGWESLGGLCTDGVGVSSWAANRLDCFVIGNNRRLFHRWWDGSQWRGWEDLGGQLYSAPAAVSWGSNRIDVFALGQDRAMWHRWWDGSAWRGWESLGGLCTDGVGVSSWAANRLDCFVIGNNRRLFHKWWDGSQWRGWEDLGGQLYSAPAAVSWGPNRIDVFALGRDRAMWHRWWDGSAWRGWESLGGLCTDGVGVSSWAANRLDCFVIGSNRRLFHKWWDGSQWLGWEDLGGELYSAPAAVSWGPNRIDVFALGQDRAMWHKWYA